MTGRSPAAAVPTRWGRLSNCVKTAANASAEAFRRRIGRQLNFGETLNELRRFIFYAHRGQILHRRHEDQTMQAHCHTLVVNACILSTTWYLHDAVDADRGNLVVR